MKQVLVLSGKGGTGKTSIVAALIHLMKAKAYADCDVDAPNLHLLMKPEDQGDRKDFYGLQKAVIHREKCTQCDSCRQHCRFEAIRKSSDYVVDTFACEGCGVCQWICPSDAITMEPVKAGDLKRHWKPTLFSTAQLRMGSGNSGLLVTEVKKRMKEGTEMLSEKVPITLIDGSPGIGCPVIASITGVDLVLIVAEPSVSGISDMKRVIETAMGLNAQLAVCINQWDNSPEHSQEIRDFCDEHRVPLLGEVPYDPTVVDLVNRGLSMAEEDGAAGKAVEAIHEKLMQIISFEK
ncbi:ATP-binding protein [Tindallia californiensis]|uniref:MinD superfamily P-loop ATPase, contains an inserted ferredoxin domain n=1 Tax=Tindallia californiensis TaxID=159292 RepID=A0A1H3MEP5_9FIRM|nr:ATP-binding protein [Tindallia californiensis]SDY75157.1 MinD superfamily P-loop ATPase, contains an inserted ferredoxin domain [Tindallia californiensis]